MASVGFFESLPAIKGFERISDPENYQPLPDDWEVGIADVVSSTDAILQGRYKAVNTAGAAVISAISNALGTIDFPYVFTGDGMCYAVGPEQAERARNALAASIGWVGTELSLTLRGGVIAVSAIRSAGKDVRVARFAPSDNAVYAMFSGGGLAWVDGALKAGRLPQPVAPTDARPDLSGLSCRFRPVRSRNGVIASIIVTPNGDAPTPSFEALVSEIVALASHGGTARPVVASSLTLRWPPEAFMQEVRLSRRDGEAFAVATIRVAVRTFVAFLIMRIGRDIGSFSPARYQSQLVENSDFRKYEDGLMMTLDCSTAMADRIEVLLAEATAAGVAHCGLHRQDSALITCFVPSPTRPDHVHFVDGAAGGYALAARALKQSRGRATAGSSPEPEAVTSSRL